MLEILVLLLLLDAIVYYTLVTANVGFLVSCQLVVDLVPLCSQSAGWPCFAAVGISTVDEKY